MNSSFRFKYSKPAILSRYCSFSAMNYFHMSCILESAHLHTLSSSGAAYACSLLSSTYYSTFVGAARKRSAF